MGMTRKKFGRISIETRGRSFYIHASYGYSFGRRLVGSLDFDTEFIHPDTRDLCTIVAKFPAQVSAYPIDGSRSSGAAYSIMNNTLVEVPGTEEFDNKNALAWRWVEMPHPEFLLEDVDDLIAALTELRDQKANDA